MFKVVQQKLDNKEFLINFLLPEERKYLDGLVTEYQKNYFLIGRVALRMALKGFSANEISLLPNHNNKVVQVPGMLTSISHKANVAVAIAGNATGTFKSVGIDLETVKPSLNRKLLEKICKKDEILRLESAHEILNADLIFSLKEASYKMFYTTIGEKVHLDDIQLIVDNSSINLYTDIFDIKNLDGTLFEENFNATKSGKFTIILKQCSEYSFNSSFKAYAYFWMNKKWIVSIALSV